jgi:REP element-mobilizing transposase RayT
MARKLRVEYPGALYHLLSRGNHREPIFKDDQDRRHFVEALAEACSKTGWQVHAYVLMPNHFHLVAETPQPNLVAGMKWLLGKYTNRFNRRHKLTGHLFAGRYKAMLVDGSGNGYLKTVCDYVHLNPARAKLLQPEQPLADFVWSSWPAYLLAPSKRPAWLRVDRLLGEHGIPKDSPAGRRELEMRVEAQRASEDGGRFQTLRRGWCLGSDAFREELVGKMSERMGREHYGTERAETDEAKAARVVVEELKRRKWTEKTLRERPKGDPDKVKIAQRLRAETVLPVAWIAERLHLGSRNYANFLLWRAAR